jgi:hypothetical protein
LYILLNFGFDFVKITEIVTKYNIKKQERGGVKRKSRRFSET